MELTVASGETVEVNDQVFDSTFNEPLVHQVVQAFLSNGHTGTRAQKSRSQVRGGGSKPWRQKGTGRARAGTSSSPIWRGGGVTFAAKPQVRCQKVNRKMYRGAMRSILSELIRQDRLVVTTEFDVDSPKTKQLHQTLQELNSPNALILVSQPSKNLQAASSNLKFVELLPSSQINPVSLVAFEKVLMDVDVLKNLEATLI